MIKINKEYDSSTCNNCGCHNYQNKYSPNNPQELYIINFNKRASICLCEKCINELINKCERIK
jgi:hypothetical protein